MSEEKPNKIEGALKAMEDVQAHHDALPPSDGGERAPERSESVTRHPVSFVLSEELENQIKAYGAGIAESVGIPMSFSATIRFLIRAGLKHNAQKES